MTMMRSKNEVRKREKICPLSLKQNFRQMMDNRPIRYFDNVTSNLYRPFLFGSVKSLAGSFFEDADRIQFLDQSQKNLGKCKYCRKLSLYYKCLETRKTDDSKDSNRCLENFKKFAIFQQQTIVCILPELLIEIGIFSREIQEPLFLKSQKSGRNLPNLNGLLQKSSKLEVGSQVHVFLTLWDVVVGSLYK